MSSFATGWTTSRDLDSTAKSASNNIVMKDADNERYREAGGVVEKDERVKVS